MKIIDLTTENMAEYGMCGYKDVTKHKELRSKINWAKELFPRGLRIKAMIADDGSYQGMLEYIPGEYAHRPVNAQGYMFIHCIFVGFKKEYKAKGYASLLLEECIQEAKAKNMKGLAVVTRKGSFMSGNKIFLKNGFQIVEKMTPDFELLTLKFDTATENPSFKQEAFANIDNYSEGLTIMRSVQCPYTEKNVNAIVETAKKKFNIEANLVDLTLASEVQMTPCAFGTFCIIYNGKVISHHPISNTRFENIMTKALK